MISISMWATLSHPLVLIFIGLMVGLGLVGFLDDYLKISKSTVDGLSGKLKLVFQIIIGIVAVWALYSQAGIEINDLWVPLKKTPILSMPVWELSINDALTYSIPIVAILFGAFVVVVCIFGCQEVMAISHH